MRVYKIVLDVLFRGKLTGWETRTYNVIAASAEKAHNKVCRLPKSYTWEDDDGKKVEAVMTKVELREAEIICELGLRR